MKKIFFIDQYNKIGGGQSVLIDLINSFTQLGYKCHLAIPEGGYIEQNVNNVTFHYLPSLNLNNTKKSPSDVFKLFVHYVKIYKIKKDLKGFDFIYINGPRYFALFYLLSKLVPGNYIYHIHIDFPIKIKQLINRIISAKRTNHVIFTTEYIKNEFLSSQPIISEQNLKKLTVLEPCFSEKYSKLSFCSASNTEKTVLNVISVGRIIPEKGFDIILQLAKEYLSSSFYIVGSPEKDSIRYYNHLKSIAPLNVIFYGTSNDIPTFVKDNNITVAVIPSEWNEPFGLVAIELMMCSCLTIVRNRGGLIQIANNTGAMLFEGIEDLKTIFENIFLLKQSEVTEKAESQYVKTKHHYNPEHFTQMLKEMLQ